MKNMIFESDEYKKIKELAVPTTNNSDLALKNIVEFLKKAGVEKDKIEKCVDIIKVLRKEAFNSGIHKGLELERNKEIKWRYE